MTGVIAFIALMLGLWAVGASQAAWRKCAQIHAELYAQGREAATESVTEVDWKQEADTYVVSGTERIATGEAFRCNSCREVKRTPPEFLTKVDLNIPFLDGELPIHVSLCSKCVSGA